MFRFYDYFNRNSVVGMYILVILQVFYEV